MIKWSISLRALALLRRIARAEEVQAAALAGIATTLHDDYAKRYNVKDRTRRPVVDFSVMDESEVSKEWTRARAEEIIEVPDFADSSPDEASEAD